MMVQQAFVTLALAAAGAAALAAGPSQPARPAASGPAAPGAPGGPAVGEAAPAFSLPGSDGHTHALADYAGKKAVVLAWFPKAFTGG